MLYPKESIQHTEHGKSLKLRVFRLLLIEAVELITPQMPINSGKSLNIVEISVELQQVPTLKCTDVHKNLFELLCTLLKTARTPSI